MKVLLQRVKAAGVSVAGTQIGQIGTGLVLFIGIHRDDVEEGLRYCAKKCLNLRIFQDEMGRMNSSVLDVGGSILAISQFTLYGDCAKGRRPSFNQAAEPGLAQDMYCRFVEMLKESKARVECGIFGADMQVEIHNDGPVTLFIEWPV